MRKMDLKELYDQFLETGNIRIPFLHKIIGFYIIICWARVLLRKPRLFVKITMAKIFKLGKTTFRALSIVVDYKCNLNCPHCNVASTMMRNDKERMTSLDYIRLNNESQYLGEIN